MTKNCERNRRKLMTIPARETTQHKEEVKSHKWSSEKKVNKINKFSVTIRDRWINISTYGKMCSQSTKLYKIADLNKNIRRRIPMRIICNAIAEIDQHS